LGFLNLEEKQPDIYKLPDKMKKTLGVADWPLILEVVRGELPETDVHTFFHETGNFEDLVCEGSIPT
jgi:hypothetical protein